MNKRGITTIQFFEITQVVLAVFVLIALLTYVQGVASNSQFEQNFLARDLGLLLDTAHAAPGSLSVNYDASVQENKLLFMEFMPETKFRFAFDHSRVFVFGDSFGNLYSRPIVYEFGEDSKLKFTFPGEGDISTFDKSSEGYSNANVQSNILIKKTNDAVSVEYSELDDEEYPEVKNE